MVSTNPVDLVCCAFCRLAHLARGPFKRKALSRLVRLCACSVSPRHGGAVVLARTCPRAHVEIRHQCEMEYACGKGRRPFASSPSSVRHLYRVESWHLSSRESRLGRPDSGESTRIVSGSGGDSLDRSIRNRTPQGAS